MHQQILKCPIPTAEYFEHVPTKLLLKFSDACTSDRQTVDEKVKPSMTLSRVSAYPNLRGTTRVILAVLCKSTVVHGALILPRSHVMHRVHDQHFNLSPQKFVRKRNVLRETAVRGLSKVMVAAQ